MYWCSVVFQFADRYVSEITDKHIRCRTFVVFCVHWSEKKYCTYSFSFQFDFSCRE